ncbi:tyrosine-protein kinase STK [Strongylocentrotus purpuratus]|uniref:Tyrosine-protein kinase n=1 Tax=Strongylocentrotus purpuratus TaxID=7668 RepID=A0A7M7SXX9_STRPU|nr:tyrosine-protein kinase STK [Strongylocentrotus purpuratus]
MANEEEEASSILLPAESWDFGMCSRQDAEKKLMAIGINKGQFIVRDKDPGTFELSVRDNDPQKGDHVKHYKIHQQGRGNGFFIFQGSVFPTVSELVRHYQSNIGLCCILTEACPKENPNTIGLGKDKWEIPRESLRLTKQIGKGHCAEVWKGVYGNTPVAVKTLKVGSNMSQADFLAEANVMKKVRHHKGILQIFAVCSDSNRIYIVTKLMSNGNLQAYLKRGKGKVTKLTTLIDMGAHIASGMDYLGSKNVVHRDLTAKNVLVGEGNVVKIADFGLARLMKKDVYVGKKGAKLPIRWTAPEAALYGSFTIKSDVWSFGILLTEMVTYGGYPYDKMISPEPVKTNVANGYRMPKMDHCPDSLYEIMLKCWHKDPQQRPTFKCLHDYFVSTKPNYKEAD